MNRGQWYLICAFVLASVFSFMVNGIDGVSASVMMQTSPLPPGNDNFANATTITLPFFDVMDIGGATLEPSEPQNCYMSKSIWYRFEPSANTPLKIDVSGSNFDDTILTIWQGTAIDGLGAVTCTGWGNAPIKFTASAGQTYYIQIGRSWDQAWGELHLNVEQMLPPLNDDFANAEQIGGLPFNGVQDTMLASKETIEPVATCGYDSGGGTVWYAYTPTTDSSLHVYVDNAYYSSVLAVYTGPSLDSLNEEDCRATYNGGFAFSVKAGTTYYFQIGSLYGESGQIAFHLDVAGSPLAGLNYYPGDPSIFDTLEFYDSSYDPYGGGIQSRSWSFGDGTTANDCCPSHRYTADGDYTVTLEVTTYDGRTALATQNIGVKTHDVSITKFTAPNSANAGQTRTISVGLNSRRYDETVEVRLFKSNPGDPWNQWMTVGTLTQFVPVRPSNRTTDFSFSYTFTPSDAQMEKVSFKAVAMILTSRDALPADNEAISPPTKVGGRARTGDASETVAIELGMPIFLPLITGK